MANSKRTSRSSKKKTENIQGVKSRIAKTPTSRTGTVKDTTQKLSVTPEEKITTKKGGEEPESSQLPKIPPTLKPDAKRPLTDEEIRETLRQITIENLSIFIKAAVQVMRSYKLPDQFIQRILRESVVVMNMMAQPKKEPPEGVS